MGAYPNPVSFRLDDQYARRLQEEAAKYEQSSGEFARRLVLDALEDTERQRLRDALQTLQEEVANLRTATGPPPREGSPPAGETPELRAEVTALREELGDLRLDLAAAVTALLVGAGRVGKEDAQVWVKQNLVK